MTGTDFFLKTIFLKVAQLLRNAACLQINQSRSYLNHLVLAGKKESLSVKVMFQLSLVVRYGESCT
jgi:hypothetical protein